MKNPDRDFLHQIWLWSLLDRAFPYVQSALIVLAVLAIVWRMT